MSDLREELTKIYKQHGRLTPRLVVEEATPRDHPLHSRFEWDDAVAGDRYRVHQAHELIQSVRVTYRPGTESELADVREFHAVRRPTGIVYEPIERVAEDDFASRLVLAEAERAWRDLKRRFGHLEEFIAMIRQDINGDAA